MEQNNSEYRILTANVKKELIYLSGLIFMALLAIGLFVFISKYINLFEVFNFSEFFNIEKSVFIKYAVIIIGSIVGAFVLLKYLSLKSTSYCFYRDKLIIKKGRAKEIPYSEITNVSYKTEGNFIENLFDVKTIVILLSDIKKEPIKLKFIDNIEQNAEYIKKLVGEYKYKVQSEIHQEKRYDQIVGKL